MIICPNKNSKDWKLLVENQGEDIAYYLWAEHNGEVPSSYYQTKNANLPSFKERLFSNTSVLPAFEILETIANSTHPFAPLAAKLNEFEGGLAFPIEIIDAPYIEGTKEDKKLQAAGLYDPAEHIVKIASLANDKDLKAEVTIIHEVIHALTYAKLREDTLLRGNLQEIYEVAKFEINKDLYALSDLDEFITGIFTDKELIKELKRIKPINKEFKNLWEEIWDYFTAILNIDKGNSLYKQAFSVASEILEDTPSTNKRYSKDNSDIKYQPVDQLTPEQRQSIQDLKQIEPIYADYSDEIIQEFIDNIYPDSKVKGIFWHGTIASRFNVYDDEEGEYVIKVEKLYNNSHVGTLQAANDRIEGVRFNSDSIVEERSEDLIIPVVINSNPLQIIDQEDSDLDWQAEVDRAKKEGYDSVSYINIKEDAGSVSYLLPKSEQVTLLNSPKTLEKFQEFAGIIYTQVNNIKSKQHAAELSGAPIITQDPELVLEEVIYNSVSDTEKELALKFKSLLKYNKNLSFAYTYEPELLRGSFGIYSITDNSILIADDVYNSPNKLKKHTIILHEFVHAFTSNELYNNPNSKFSKQIQNLFEVVSNNEGLKTYLESTPKDSYTPINYALTDVHEFLAEALTNKDFQKFLSSIPYDSKRSTWDKFLEALYNFFGVSFENTVLEEVLNNFDEFIADLTSDKYNTPSSAEESVNFAAKIPTTIKPEVSELFESNPELANEVYSALGFEQESNLPTSITSILYELEPNITDEKIKTIYNNYVELMNKKREGKSVSFNVFKKLLNKYQVYKYKDTYIFGQYDSNTATFITRMNSSPTSKELLAEAIPNLVEKGIDFISFVPKDYADKLVRSGYTSSTSSFKYDFKGENMDKFAVASNPNVFKKIFNKDSKKVTSEEIESFNKNIELKYTPVEIKEDLIDKAGKDLSKILETYLNQFGIVVKDINDIKDKLGIDELGFADILSKIAYIKDKKDLPPVAGEFIAYMMQYNPLVSSIIEELSQTNDYKNLDKSEYFKIIGDLISKDLQNKLKGDYSKSLLAKLKQLIKNFFSLLNNTPVDLINKNVGIISNNILQQNKKLITASLYKPGAFGKPTKQVSLEDAKEADSFGKSIIDRLSKKGFILTGSTSLGEQGTILRPNENLLHDIDWVSPFNREETKEKFLKAYTNAVFVRDIYGDDYTTDTWVIAPDNYSVENFITETYIIKDGSKRIIIKSYDIVDKKGKVSGTYRLQKQENSNQTEEVVTGIEGKVIDFFSYEEYNQLPPFKKDNVKLSNWKDIFKAKLNFARYKDIWDYNRFIPNENINQITPQQKQEAQQLYSQYLDTIFPDSKVTEIDNSLYINVLNQLEQENKIEKDCTGEGKLKAKDGIATLFEKGGQWEIVTDFKNAPTHKSGGKDIFIQGKKVEVEKNELRIENDFGDVAVIPSKYRIEVQDAIKSNCHSCIDGIVESLPKMKDYAGDGTVFPFFGRYKRFKNSLPDNLKNTPEDDYAMRYYWKKSDKPKSFDEAINREQPMFTMEDDGYYHAPSVEPNTLRFLKPKNHPTLQYELDWYNSDNPDAVDFRSKYDLDTSGKFYKYVPKKK